MSHPSRPDPSPAPRGGRRDSGAERRVDAAILGGALVAAIGGCAVLFLMLPAEARPLSVAALGLYAAGLLAMLSCALAYSLARRPALRRLDHAAIFVMIAGSYTPFALVAIGGPGGWVLAGFVWSGALAGAVAKLAWPERFEHASLPVYLVLGWTVLAAAPWLVGRMPADALALLLAGGLLYSLGLLFHVARRMPFQNEAWHACVVAAAGCHYIAIMRGVVPLA